jgi:hypothetical protein
MTTWIGHLRIAELVFPRIPGLDETAFTFGNLAPDSGLPNEDWSAFTPPKEVTHFLGAGEGEGRIRDMDFWRGYLAPGALGEDRSDWSFLLGYFCHLLSDNLWSKRIGGPTKRTHAALFAANQAAAWENMKTDWYGLDQRYVREYPASSFWRVLMSTPNPERHVPFIPVEGLHQQLDHIRQFYSQPAEEWVLDRPFPYLNEPTMARYVRDTADDLVAIYRQWEALGTLEGPTALALLPPERLAPYPEPLGDMAIGHAPG